MASASRFLGLAALTVTLSFAQDASGRANFQERRLAPYVVSPPSVVDRMLEAAAPKSGETLYDLGCGDGRILIAAVQKFRVKAVGVELSPTLAKMARENLEKNKVQDLASVIQDDAMNVDLHGADIVTLYLTTEFNSELRPNLEKYLRAGTRVVSLDYPVPGWKPQRKETADIYNHKHAIYIYTMPPRK